MQENVYFYNINFCIKLFNLMGSHPEKGGNIIQILRFILGVLTNLSLIFLSILLLVVKEKVTITDITNSFDSIGLLLHGLLKFVNVFVKRSQILNLLKEMEANFWKLDDIQDANIRSEHEKFLQLLKKVLKFFTFICVFLAVLTVIKGFEIYIPEWFPFYLTRFYHGWGCFMTVSLPVISTDLFIFTIFMLTSLQFQLLNEEIRCMFGGEEENHLDLDTVKNRIRRCSDRHIFLQEFVKMLNDTFSQVLFIYNGDIVLSLCVEMYIVSTQNSFEAIVKAALYVFTGIFQYTVCYCIAAQAITDQAEEISNSIYFSKWYEYADSHTRTAVIIMMANAQKPTIITALKFLKINLETCLKTIQTMLSYCMFLRTMGISSE